MAVIGWLAMLVQQLVINWLGNRLLVKLRTDMFRPVDRGAQLSLL